MELSRNTEEVFGPQPQRGRRRIIIRLPSADDAGHDSAPVAPRRDAAIAGRILLAEEEEAVLQFEHDVLVGAGAEVVTEISEVRQRSVDERKV